jgi:hypothetical protein
MDPFRQVFLDQVRVVVAKEASKESLYELLRIATPPLTIEDVSIESRRKKAFMTLQLRIHPDKHPGSDTTAIFQKVKAFYDDCCAASNKKRKTNPVSPPNTSHGSFPRDFHVNDKWPFLNIERIPPCPSELSNDADLMALTVAQCINARGAIAHGQATELCYQINRIKRCNSVKEAFDGYGGTRCLTSIDSIKKELTENGPVLSESFVLDPSFLSAGVYSPSFLHSRIGKKHELLIIGWKLTAFGEVWLVKPLNERGGNLVHIAFGQFGIDTTCLAPVNNFENVKWQSGPSFNTTFGATEWMTWPGMDMYVTSSELEALAECFKSGLVSAVSKKETFVIRDKKKKAHSRRYYLNELTWNKDKKMWSLGVTKVT